MEGKRSQWIWSLAALVCGVALAILLVGRKQRRTASTSTSDPPSSPDTTGTTTKDITPEGPERVEAPDNGGAASEHSRSDDGTDGEREDVLSTPPVSE